MKKTNIIFWIATGLLFLTQGVMTLVFFGSEMSKQGMAHLGYPTYFGNALSVCKILGALALVIPQVPKRLKELAYAGFAFDFIFAFISHVSVDGFTGESASPLIALAILTVSYIYYHKRIDG